MDGQDLDIPFVVKDQDTNGNKLDYLLNKFMGYCNTSYPNTQKNFTKSSVEMIFTSPAAKIDIVPFLNISGSNNELLIKRNWEQRETNLEQHKEFIRSRTKKSNEVNSQVAFNGYIRLIKWWRIEQCNKKQGTPEAIEELPSFLMNLLCAKAFDTIGIQESHIRTLASWFGLLANLVKNKKCVYFNDFNANAQMPPESFYKWQVLDPVNFDNNAAQKFQDSEITNLSNWLSETSDKLNQIIAYDLRNEESKAMDLCCDLFGSSFKNHC